MSLHSCSSAARDRAWTVRTGYIWMIVLRAASSRTSGRLPVQPAHGPGLSSREHGQSSRMLPGLLGISSTLSAGVQRQQSRRIDLDARLQEVVVHARRNMTPRLLAALDAARTMA